jgi:inorganic triphosphatase YgiF
MPQPHREFELKLDLTKAELDRLAGNPKLHSAGAASRKILRSVYYDTPDHRLHAEGISLRVRGDGKSFIQTVKLDTDLKNGISNPVEVEDAVAGGKPDPGLIHDKRVRRKVEQAVKGSGLTQAFETVVTRTTRRLRTRGSVMELALDKGETVAMNRRSEICEAELELVSGHPKDLLEAAQSLFAKSGVRLSALSKAERGYRLLLKRRPSQKIEPVRAEPPDIAKGQTCGEAFAEILRAVRQQIVKNRTVVLETDEPEGAHQLRVGLTRLRSAQRALTPLLDSPQLRHLENDAQEISRAVGHLRDADVLIEDIYAPVAGSPPHKPGFDELYEGLKAHRAAMQKEARQILSGEAWSRLLLNLTLWPAMLERDASLQDPVEDYSGNALQKRWKNSAKLGRKIGSLEGDSRHKMRKSLKKLRYTVEFLASLYPKGKVKPFVKQLKKLQDVFGYVNDVAMAGQLREISTRRLGSEPGALIAAGAVLGHHETLVPQTWAAAPKEWRRLKKRGRFWR